MNETFGPFTIGESYLIRTVTYFQLGKVKGGRDGFVELEEASWVASTGRFGQALAKGSLDEVEYEGSSFVGLGAIVDFFPWPHPLPSESK